MALPFPSSFPSPPGTEEMGLGVWGSGRVEVPNRCPQARFSKEVGTAGGERPVRMAGRLRRLSKGTN